MNSGANVSVGQFPSYSENIGLDLKEVKAYWGSWCWVLGFSSWSSDPVWSVAVTCEERSHLSSEKWMVEKVCSFHSAREVERGNRARIPIFPLRLHCQ